MSARPQLTVAIPIFNEEKNIPALLDRLMPVLDGMKQSYEVLCVDDGSRDNSLNLLKEAAEKNKKHIRVVELSRNFGQHPALLAACRGLTLCRCGGGGRCSATNALLRRGRRGSIGSYGRLDKREPCA
jgi:cellulose synthase/poly-beta-1,6-N-acetylglucosamine synthase-like glycosyltransferase